MNTTRGILFLALAALPGACTVGPDYAEPVVTPPQAWVEPADNSPAADGPWWRTFHDPVLDSLIERAAASSTDVRVAAARLREARARRGVVTAALWPRVDASGSFSNSRFSENGFLQGLGGGGGAGLPGAIVPGQQINLWQAGVDASWEIDLFGGSRRATEAATADLAAAEFAAGDVLRSVAAEVAGGYVEYRGLQERAALARRTAESQQRTLDVVGEQAKAGIASDLDLAKAQTQASAAAAEVPPLEAAERVAVRRLEVLLGQMPGTLDAELDAEAPVPTPPDALATGVPSEALRRRPDVRAAERRLAASTARIGEATAALYPRFSLTGSFGLQSQELEDLPAGDSRFWVIGPSVRWPILDFGRVRSAIGVQDARTDAALAEYEGTILQALSDVEVALVQITRERRRGADVQRAAEAADRALRLSEDLYHGGLLEFTDLLEAQRAQYVAHDSEAQSRAAVALDAVALYKALGGGWK
jgi:NodT family efflux transporter outer membrane factor (OMF) lipoprotein